MKYSDLVKFEPIESVIQLEQADSPVAVRQLVQTFVISKRMAEQLCDLVIPNLQFETPADNKGVLIVGNYGTGKSHLLALISGLAEHPDMAKVVKDKNVAGAATAISGKFKVVRLEIPAAKKSLRNIICGRLEDFMSSEGLSFSFPADDQVDSNKDDLSNMMAQLNEKYPDHGLLLVVDELLDYLRSRRQHDLILDLGFLREIGEVCRLIRFRFIAGLQESLFDNPKFQFVAESLRRVRDRFEQLRIVRQDVAYVVSERLLTKTDKQRAKIREHLQKFTPLYGGMAERLEEFVRLFPVHPTYLEVFEAISIAEKREILKTLSAEIKSCLNDDVPQQEPGVISYDSYWEFLQGNAVLRSVPEIRDVIDVSKVVENRIQQAFTRKALQPMAERIIHGLSIHRLTTDDIRAKIGPTAEELQNGLCLIAPIPEKTSDFLRTTVEACLKEVMKTVSGQFITHNSENDQYYLDLQKTIDHDAKIQDKAETLSDSHLDQYYFDALTRVLELTDQPPYVRGYQIWEHEIEWREHKITRRGYLFFGAPNERSTAQPPRDFYLYFLQPFEPPHFEGQKLADEVFFKLTHQDKQFQDTLRLYAGAREMAASASSTTKKVYEDKADESLKTLVAWLRTNMLTSFEVVHQGVPKKLVEWLKGHRTGGATVRDLLELTGSVCLATAFEDRYPEYPKFTVKLHASNLKQPTEDVLRWLAGGVKNNQATAVLDGLELLDGDKLKPHQSRYTKVVLEKLEGKPPGQVVNRKELITVKNDVERERQYQLEPEFLLIVLASLVQNGNITLSVAGKKLDAANLGEATKMPLDQLVAFKHVEKPKGLPLAELVALFELLGLAEGLIRNENAHDEAVKQLRIKANELTEKIVTVAQHVQTGLPCWGSELIPAEDRADQRKKLDDLKTFLEGLQAFNTPGKLKNFSRSVLEIQGHIPTLDLIKQIENLNALAQELTALTSYLGTAAAVLSPQDPWRAQLETTRSEWRAKLMDPTVRSAADFRQKIDRALQDVKDDYRTAYFNLHRKARLGANEDGKKKELLKDVRLESLKKLAGVSLLSHSTLTELQSRLAKVQTCFTLVKDDLDSSPICLHCNFRPQEENLGASGVIVLDQIDQQLDGLLENWTKTLLDNLDDPTARKSITLLSEAQKQAVDAFFIDKKLPEKISNDLVQHPAIAKATIAQLLSHSAGVVRDGADSGQWQDRRPFLDVAELRTALAEPPVIGGNTRFKYSNHGFGLIGLVIEAVTGERYTDWILRTIVDRAGLAETASDVPVADDVPVASGHSGRLPLGRRVVIPGNNPTNALAAATGFVSTAGDLAKFFAALDPAARRTPLTVESRHEMIRRQWRDPHSSIERHYGLGLWSGTTAGWDWFGHGGSFQGFITRTAVFPGYDLSVSILTNARDGLANQWVDGVCQILAIFATHGAPTPRVRDWTGRWWSLWGAVDLVPMGRRVLVANLDLPAPFTDASELSVTGEDRGRIELANGTGSHGEGVRRVRGPDGKVAEVWPGGGRLLLESEVVTEIVDRYATIRSPEIEQSGPSSPSNLRGYL